MTTMIIFYRYMINSVMYNTIQLYHDLTYLNPNDRVKTILIY